MPVQMLFWVIYILSVFFVGWTYYVPGQAYPVRMFGGSFILWVLVGLLGYATFGPAIK
jgi:hypothetical protein